MSLARIQRVYNPIDSLYSAGTNVTISNNVISAPIDIEDTQNYITITSQATGDVLVYDDSVAVWQNARLVHFAASDPSPSDDSSGGYVVGTLWCNTTGNRLFVCENNNFASATWTLVVSGTAA